MTYMMKWKIKWQVLKIVLLHVAITIALIAIKILLLVIIFCFLLHTEITLDPFFDYVQSYPHSINVNFTCMDLSIFSLLIWTTIPAGLTFNQFGVAQSKLSYTFKYNKLEVTISVCAVNGIWGGAYNIMTNLWGCGAGISQDSDFKYNSFEECTDSLWKSVLNHVDKGKDNVLKEFERLKKTFEKWSTLNTEDKMKWFKLDNGILYDTF